MDMPGMDMPGMNHSHHTMAPPLPSSASNTSNLTTTNGSSSTNSSGSGMDMNMGMTMVMQMFFYWGPQVTLLFSSWSVSSWPAYLGSLLFCLLLAVIYEGMAVLRVVFAARIRDRMRREREVEREVEAGNEKGKSSPSGSHSSRGRSWTVGELLTGGRITDRLLASLLIGVSAALGYLLMLMIMTFNVGVFIAVVLGHSLGVLLFGGVRILTEGSVFADPVHH